jgi:hypothetical protein
MKIGSNKPRKTAGISGTGGSNVTNVYKPYVQEQLDSPRVSKKISQLEQNPKTATQVFTIPKGAKKLPQSEIDAMQKRRIADRKRTIARAKLILRDGK